MTWIYKAPFMLKLNCLYRNLKQLSLLSRINKTKIIFICFMLDKYIFQVDEYYNNFKFLWRVVIKWGRLISGYHKFLFEKQLSSWWAFRKYFHGKNFINWSSGIMLSKCFTTKFGDILVSLFPCLSKNE